MRKPNIVTGVLAATRHGHDVVNRLLAPKNRAAADSADPPVALIDLRLCESLDLDSPAQSGLTTVLVLPIFLGMTVLPRSHV